MNIYFDKGSGLIWHDDQQGVAHNMGYICRDEDNNFSMCVYTDIGFILIGILIRAKHDYQPDLSMIRAKGIAESVFARRLAQ